MSQNVYFDAAALTWDDNPQMVERSRIVAEHITRDIPLHTGMRCLELGAGTGRISFELSSRVASILMLDASPGMVEVMNRRIVQTGASNLIALNSTLGPGTFPGGNFDLVFSSMALHHIPDVGSLLEDISSRQPQGGHLVLVDLVTEDGSFHAHAPELPVYKGFDTGVLTRQVESTGYQVNKCHVFYEIQRRQEDGSMKTYPLFMLRAERNQELSGKSPGT